MRRWLTIIGSLLMGLSSVAYGSRFVLPMKTDGTWWTTIVATLATGGALVGGAQFRTVKKTVGMSVMPEIEAVQQADLNALNHLTERFAAAAAAGNPKFIAAVELCRTMLSEHLFTLHYLLLPGEPVPEPAPEPAANASNALAEMLGLLQQFRGTPVPPVSPVVPAPVTAVA